jgi:hypothetical protein
MKAFAFAIVAVKGTIITIGSNFFIRRGCGYFCKCWKKKD